MPARKDDGLSRLERAALARKLRDRGFTHQEIAKALGISRSYASGLVTDPDGSKDRARKQNYRGTCIDCGGKTTYGARKGKPILRCSACDLKYRGAHRLWPRERIIERIRTWNEIYGEPPKSSQWLLEIRGDGTPGSRLWPTVGAVQEAFGSWSNGIEAAGFERRVIGGYERTPEWKAKRRKWSDEVILQKLREWAAEHGGQSPSSTDPVGPAYYAVYSRFGSWNNALRAAGLEPRPGRGASHRNGKLPPVPSFEERGKGIPLLQVVRDLQPTQKGKSLLDVVQELSEGSSHGTGAT